MKKCYVHTLLCFLIPFLPPIRGYGQNYNETPAFLKANSHWIFGTNAGLNFNNGSPVSFQAVMDAKEGPATVSDAVTGDLLFYSNGQDCRNALGNIMPNGDSLLGNSNYSSNSNNGRSTTQGTCIVPVIGDPDQYYVFSLNGMTSSQPNYTLGSLFYSIVDMTLDGGTGDILPDAKNVPINADVLSESMIAVPGNNCDIWLIVHAFEMDEFLAYHITADGIAATPVVSSTGGGTQLYGYLTSWMAISPDRERIAISGGTTPPLVAQFDPETGTVSNAITLSGTRDLCFSPDNTKLYIMGSNTALYQFDISVYDSASINSSRVSIPITQMGDLRLYNDTIYFKPTTTLYPYIDRINQPNLSGTACDYEINAISQLTGTSQGGGGMGSDVVFPLSPDTFDAIVLDTTICPKSGIVLTPNNSFDLVEWSDGSTEAALEITESGTYWALLNDGCHYHVDTFIIHTYDFPEPVISVNVLELGTVDSYDAYQWLLNGSLIPDATQSTYNVTENGDYQVIVTNGDGCVDTSAVYVVTNAGGNSIDEVDYLARQIGIYPNPASDIININSPVLVHVLLSSIEGKTILYMEKAKQISLQGIAAGVYFLKIYDQQNRQIKIEKVIKSAR